MMPLCYRRPASSLPNETVIFAALAGGPAMQPLLCKALRHPIPEHSPMAELWPPPAVSSQWTAFGGDRLFPTDRSV